MNNYYVVLYTISDWIIKLIITNIIWAIFNLPLVFILLQVYLTQNAYELARFFIPLFVLLIVCYVPTTSALYCLVRSWIIHPDRTTPLLKSFLFFYKQSYFKSMKGGAILVVFWLIWGLYFYYLNNNPFLYFIVILLGVILLVFTNNFFSCIAHYNSSTIDTIKKAAFYTFGSPFLFLTTVLNSTIIIYLSLFVFPLALLFISGSLYALLTFIPFYKFYFKLKKAI